MDKANLLETRLGKEELTGIDSKRNFQKVFKSCTGTVFKSSFVAFYEISPYRIFILTALKVKVDPTSFYLASHKQIGTLITLRKQRSDK